VLLLHKRDLNKLECRRIGRQLFRHVCVTCSRFSGRFILSLRRCH